MFSDIFKLHIKRTALQALGFYIAYLLLLIIVCAIAGAIAGTLSGGGFQAGLEIGQFIAILSCLILGFAILKQKSTFSLGYVLLALLAGVLAALGGGLLGLIPVAFLTTRQSSLIAERSE